MAHFAQIDNNSIVTQVIVINNQDILDDSGDESEAIGVALCQDMFGATTLWKQTSYNGNIRKNYAAVGSEYRASIDGFLEENPFPGSWTLNEDLGKYECPVAMPTDGYYEWNGNTWISITNI